MSMKWFRNLNLSKHILGYLLQKYVGNYLKEKLTLDRLSIDLCQGTGSMTDLELDVKALNELGDQQNWPVEIIEGYVEVVSITAPMKALLAQSSTVVVTGLTLTVRPKHRDDNTASMFESMWSSMSSMNLMEMAKECLEQEETALNERPPAEGIQHVATTIDSVLSKVRVKFVDTIIRCEYVPKNCPSGVAIQIEIKEMEYLDEAGSDEPTDQHVDFVQDILKKRIYIEGITLSTDEFITGEHKLSKSMSPSESVPSPDSTTETDDRLYMSASEFVEENQSESKHGSDDDDKNEENRNEIVATKPILIAKLSGRQEIRIRSKLSESANGPKLSIEMILGSLFVLLSPRQLHAIIELTNGFTSPETDNSNPHCVQKPMTPADYKFIQAAYEAQYLEPKMYPQSLQNVDGWSSALLDEFEDKFELGGDMCESVYSMTGSVESLASSASTQTVSTRSSRPGFQRTRRVGGTDPPNDVWQLDVRLSSTILVLLHEDILTPTNELINAPLTESSVLHAAQTAKKFFDELHTLSLSGYGNKDFIHATSMVEKACTMNHIRFIAAPIQFECTQRVTPQYTLLDGHCAIARLVLLECLMPEPDTDSSVNKSLPKEIERIELLTFNSINSSHNSNTTPNLTLIFKQQQRNFSFSKKSALRTEIRFHLDELQSEVDITIIDRISTLLNPNPIFFGFMNQSTVQTYSNPNELLLENKFVCEIISPKKTFKVRFPIPDMRPLTDIQRCPWWRRNVRSDFLTLQLEDSNLRVTYHSKQPENTVEVTARVFHIFYTEEDSKTSLPIGTCYGNSSTSENKFPKLLIQIYPQKILSGDLELPSVAYFDQTNSIHEMKPPTIPGPFSSKKVFHESDTLHTQSNQHEVNEEVLIPGDKDEIRNFIDCTIKSTRVRVEISLPVITAQLPSKHIFEMLYNRISTDLLLWQPSAPSCSFSDRYDGRFNSVSLNESIHVNLEPSALNYESEESEDSADNYFSIAPPVNSGQSTVTFTINIGHGILHFFTPVRDSRKEVIPRHHGEFLLDVKNTSIFSVCGYQGNDDHGFVCIQGSAVKLFHCGFVATPSGCPKLLEINKEPLSHLKPIIYVTEAGIKVPNTNATNYDMLTVVVSIKANDETERMKEIRTSCAIHDATLRVYISKAETTWLAQLQDMLDVLDYPLEGYTPSQVLNELHVHLWSCVIDYRPLKIPYCALTTIGSFSISRNIVALNKANTLRVMAEDWTLLLTNKNPPILSLTDYVCVMELGLFELSLRYRDKPQGNFPQTDLRASNNLLQLRTCSDSARALTELITYLANDGDIAAAESAMPSEIRRSSTISGEGLETLLEVDPPQEIYLLSKSQHERVIEDLHDAMQESVHPQVLGQKSKGETNFDENQQVRELFFFPDENIQINKTEKPNPQVVKELGDTAIVFPPLRSDTDDEYCIIGEEAKTMATEPGTTKLRLLTKAPHPYIKNAFVTPMGATDKLKAPKHFPQAVTRYTLCEMNIIWQIYGGKDFAQTNDKNKERKKTVYFSADKQREACDIMKGPVSFNTSEPTSVKFTSPKKNTVVGNWKTQGGPGRIFDILMELQLNKIRFRHEVYPENVQQASRQVLLISEIEIRDRLATSQINKFLYQYTSARRPKRTNSCMLEIKHSQIRPDLQLSTKESCLKISILPLRLNIDQDSIMFLFTFFSELSGNPDVSVTAIVPAQITSKHNTPTHQPPIMTVNPIQSLENSSDFNYVAAQEAERQVSENLLILLEDDLLSKPNDESSKSNSDQYAPSPIYFRDVRFEPAVTIRIDYHGKRVDMSGPGGALAGLLMGIGQLNCSEIRLRKIRHKHGISGFEKLVSYMLHEWLTDIKKNQLPSLLGGVGPMYAIVQLFAGIRDLFWLPIEQYKKDGRIVHGLQRGANSFTSYTLLAVLELTSRLIYFLQFTAETVFVVVSSEPIKLPPRDRRGRRKRYNQPQDFREGVSNAITLMKEGIEETAQTLVRVASVEHEQKGYSGAVGGILRQIPPTVVKPIILATEATNNVLGGMVCELVPDARREASQKWRTDDS